MADSNSEARGSRIAQLEARLARRAPVGVKPPVAALAVLVSGWVLWTTSFDLAYFFSPRSPISLGVEGSYRFDLARSNRYAELHGVPTVRGAYGLEGDQHFVVVGVGNTPLLVKRDALPTEEWKPGTTPPPPDQRPFTASGRLLSRAEASRWEDAFLKHDSFGEQKPKWLLLEGVRPGTGFGIIAWFALVLAFAVLNLWLLVRGLIAKRVVDRLTA